MNNVLIVEDERIVSEMFAHYIDTAKDRYNLVASIKVADNAELYCLCGNVNLIIMDICTAENSSGLAAAERIKEKYPSVKIIVATSAPEYRFIERARAAKIDSFWYKDFDEIGLLAVMDRTVAGESVYPCKTPDIKLGNAKSSEFTPKEMETLYWLIRLGKVRLIAEKMGITEDGVSRHLSELRDKTGCKTTTELAILAHSSKLVLPEY